MVGSFEWVGLGGRLVGYGWTHAHRKNTHRSQTHHMPYVPAWPWPCPRWRRCRGAAGPTPCGGAPPAGRARSSPSRSCWVFDGWKGRWWVLRWRVQLGLFTHTHIYVLAQPIHPSIYNNKHDPTTQKPTPQHAPAESLHSHVHLVEAVEAAEAPELRLGLAAVGGGGAHGGHELFFFSCVVCGEGVCA